MKAVDLVLLSEADEAVVKSISEAQFEKLYETSYLPKVLVRLNETDGERLFDKVLYELDRVDVDEKYARATKALRHSKGAGELLWRRISARVLRVATPHYRLKFWYEELVEEVDADTLRECFFKLDKPLRRQVSRKVNPAVLARIFHELIERAKRISDLAANSTWAEMLESSARWPDSERNNLVDRIWRKAGGSVRMQLWLQGHSDKFDIGEYKILFLTLTPEDQFRFVRRLFLEAERKKLNLTVDLLNELVRFEKNLAGEWDIDYSIDIALNALTDLATGKDLNEERNIGRVLAQHFERKAFQKYKIRDLFERCEGRGYAFSNGSGRGGQPPQVRLHRSTDVPPGVVFCEGRKAQGTDHKHGIQFWWCRNSPCFMPCHGEHSMDEWEKYTMRDMMRVLEISCNSEQYQAFLGMVNRVNVLLEHLNCRSCGKILMPRGQSNYGFYRASRFVCSNNDCGEKQEVYINHCLNGKCLGVVDSRDSAKCPNGLYICTNCFSCCSTKSFVRRLENLKQVGQTVPDSLQNLVEQNLGHAEQKRAFCYACGTELIGGTEAYRKALNWLVEKKDSDGRIKAAGQRGKDEGWWFIVEFPEEKYSSLKELGFEIHETKRGTGRMVSTPYGGKEHTKGKCSNIGCRRYGYLC